MVVTVTVPVFVHPFAGFVTVRVYVPDSVTSVAAEVGVEPAGVPEVGPVHVKLTPPVVELPLSVTVVVVQVIVCVVPAFTFGTVVFVATLTVPVLTHPFAGLVTVSV